MELMDCKKEIVNIVRSIKDLLNYDLVVVDRWLMTLINTFPYRRPNEDVRLNSIVGNIIVTNEALLVRNRIQSKVCLTCQDYHLCELDCIVGVPIRVREECIGAVAVLLRTSQISTLESAEQKFQHFLRQLAEVFAGFLETRSLRQELDDKNEQALQLLDHFSDLTALTDEDGIISSCNSRFSACFDFQVNEQQDLRQVLAPFSPAKQLEQLKCGDFFTCTDESIAYLTDIVETQGASGETQRLHIFKPVEVAAFLNPYVAYELDSRFQRFWGVSEAMLQARNSAIAATKNNLPVLIASSCTTQSRELMKILSRKTPGTSEISSVVNCTIDPEELELILFGDGGNYPGLIWPARHSCVCLSNIHYMPLYLQAKLTEFMNKRQFHGTLYGRVSIYATTTVDLEQLAAGGRFSIDLLNLLSHNKIVIPDIWENPDDASYYFHRFLEEFSEKYQLAAETDSDLLWKKLLESDRRPIYLELRSIAERLVVASKNGLDCTDESINLEPILTGRPPCTGDKSMEERLRELLATEPQKAKIARTLGISRATLYRWLDKYGLS